MFDITPYLNPADEWLKGEGRDKYHRIYDEKHAIASLVRPRSVAEIGVRCGYSAATFLAAGATQYQGYDATDGWGGFDGAVQWAGGMLSDKFPGRLISIAYCDAQKTDKLDLEGVDLFHVDGDHSFGGALHDLELALATCPKWILVDDIYHHPDSVAQAVWAFVGRHGLRHVEVPTLRGDVLIQVR